MRCPGTTARSVRWCRDAPWTGLIDLYKLDGNSPTSEKVFWDCYSSYQGVSSGQESNGNRKIQVLDTSPCDSPGLCGTVSANR